MKGYVSWHGITISVNKIKFNKKNGYWVIELFIENKNEDGLLA